MVVQAFILSSTSAFSVVPAPGQEPAGRDICVSSALDVVVPSRVLLRPGDTSERAGGGAYPACFEKPVVVEDAREQRRGLPRDDGGVVTKPV